MALTGVMFQNTTGAEFSIQDIRLSDDVPADGGTYMMYWAGHWEQPYWVEIMEGDWQGTGVIGWGNQDDWHIVNKTFALGEAFFFCPSSDAEAAAVIVSGQVYSCPEQYGAITLTKGDMDLISPVFPTSNYSIQSIKMSDNVPADGGTYLMYWAGHWEQPYWVEIMEGDWQGTGVIGWGNQDDWHIVNKTFNAGEGFFAAASSDVEEGDAEILFPNPLSKTE